MQDRPILENGVLHQSRLSAKLGKVDDSSITCPTPNSTDSFCRNRHTLDIPAGEAGPTASDIEPTPSRRGCDRCCGALVPRHQLVTRGAVVQRPQAGPAARFQVLLGKSSVAEQAKNAAFGPQYSLSPRSCSLKAVANLSTLMRRASAHLITFVQLILCKSGHHFVLLGVSCDI